MASKFDVSKHILVPKHTKLSEREHKALMEELSLNFKEIPKILLSDPAIQELDVKDGDIIKIERNSQTAGSILFYRRVVKG